MRGWTDLAINGSFWIGAAMGAAGSIVLLDPALFTRCRLAPGVPDRRRAGADHLLHAILDPGEPALAHDTRPRRGSLHRHRHRGAVLPAGTRASGATLPRIKTAHAPLHAARRSGARLVRRVPPAPWWASLMAAQAFFYNAIFFTYALVLTGFGVRSGRSAGTSSPSRRAISSGRSCSGACSTRSAASR